VQREEKGEGDPHISQKKKITENSMTHQAEEDGDYFTGAGRKCLGWWSRICRNREK